MTTIESAAKGKGHETKMKCCERFKVDKSGEREMKIDEFNRPVVPVSPFSV